ncbi:MAG TPA: MmcQ/YjbR family DNA-binding protein [Thermoanaerobaculia bacterium]|nr:MmcQ/YjbR family DNA-binding protein [Thermoanaerobaculia bacterium]
MTSKAVDAESLIARVREIAMALPDATEKLSHGEPSWFVNGRQFATMDNNHHGSGHVAVVCNAEEGAQEALVAAEPEHFFVPPYVGGKGWLGMRVDRGIDWKLVADLLAQAYRKTAAKKRR